MTRVALATAWVWFALAEPAWAFAPALEPGELGSFVGMCGDRPELGVVMPIVPPLEDSPIAWCLSPDDPRCAPRDTGAPTGPLFAQPQLNPSGSLVLPDVRVIGVQSVSRFWQLGAARPGIHSRVERPPR